MLSGGGKLLGCRILKTHHVASVLNDCSLHTQADTEVGELSLTSPLGDINHTTDTSSTETTRNNDTLSSNNMSPSLVELSRVLLLHIGFEVLRIDGDEVQLAFASHSRVLECFVNTEIRVVKADVLANQDNVDGFEVSIGYNGLLPEVPKSLALLSHGRSNLKLLEGEALAKKLKKTLLLEEERDLVDGVHVADANDLLVFDLAASGDLCDGSNIEFPFAAAGNLETLGADWYGSRGTYHIGDQTGASNLSDGMLSGLCLLLSIDDRDVGNADAEEVVAAESVSQLLNGC